MCRNSPPQPPFPVQHTCICDLGHLSPGSVSRVEWSLPSQLWIQCWFVLHLSFPKGGSLIVSGFWAQPWSGHCEGEKIEPMISLSLGAYRVVREGAVGTPAARVHLLWCQMKVSLCFPWCARFRASGWKSTVAAVMKLTFAVILMISPFICKTVVVSPDIPPNPHAWVARNLQEAWLYQPETLRSWEGSLYPLLTHRFSPIHIKKSGPRDFFWLNLISQNPEGLP